MTENITACKNQPKKKIILFVKCELWRSLNVYVIQIKSFTHGCGPVDRTPAFNVLPNLQSVFEGHVNFCLSQKVIQKSDVLGHIYAEI